MSYRNILVHLDSLPSCQHRISAALDLAEKFDARLTGLATTGLLSLPYGLGMDTPGQVIVELQEHLEKLARTASAKFSAMAAKRGFERAEARISSGGEISDIALHARYADLVVIGQPNPAEHTVDGTHAAPADVVLTCPRPVLTVPYIGMPKTLANHALIAWNGSREACRAVTDALPLLQKAGRVTVMAVNPVIDEYSHGPLPGADLAAYLAHHGVNVDVRADPGAVVDVADELLSRIADLNVDLLVMGAYGHSRASEWVFGGVTRSILQSMTVPVLLSH
jgi:nucleotide-binding universal stress UspA family protein